MVLIAAAGLALAACGTGDDSGGDTGGDTGDGSAAPAGEPPRPVTLMLNWTPNAHHVGIYAAAAQGWYADAGIDLTIIEPADAGVEQAIASGAADIGLAQAESLLPARAAGVPVVSIATVLPVNDSALFSLASDGITRPADLEGTRYGGFGGALGTELISALMECDAADPSSVEFVTLGNIDYLAGMAADQFDTAWVFSGWDALRAEAVEDEPIEQIRFADWMDCIPNWYTPLVLTSQSLLDEDPDLVRAFLEVTTRGYELAVDDPSTAAQLLLDEVPELDPQLVQASVDYYAPLFLPPSGVWGEQDERTWTSFADFLTTSGVSEEDLDGSTAFTNDYLPDES
jgi:ABC-type nitrate/sulfonate/bicarbonate transport system substrate-binding protein